MKTRHSDISPLEEMLHDTAAALTDGAAFLQEAERVFRFSPFIRTTCSRHPETLHNLITSGDLFATYPPGDYQKRVSAVFRGCGSETDAEKALRVLRRREMIRIAWRDLSLRADLFETMNHISAFAEACVNKTLEYLFTSGRERYGIPLKSNGKPQQLVTLAMGKLGAGELNFSSDIDLIFAFPEAGRTAGGAKSISNSEFFALHARRFLKFFGQHPTHGPLFRVDMRLRPMGDSGPLVISFNAMVNYYQSQGREWERYALVKARVISGSQKDGNLLMERLRPFVYRKYLDYGAIESLRKMKERINLERSDAAMGRNIKLGKGGIREIEFFGQVFQLVKGGLTPQLQERKILPVLEHLVNESVISGQVSEELTRAYLFLRKTEHRLQEMDDRQTHDIPTGRNERQLLAEAMGFKSHALFRKTLEGHMGRVSFHFSQLLVNGNGHAAEPSGSLASVWLMRGMSPTHARILAEHGYRSPDDVLKILDDLKHSRQSRYLGATGTKRLDRLMPGLMEKAAASDDPDLVLSRLCNLIKAIEKRICYLSLLTENPSVLDHLTRLSAKSPWLITYICRYPVLLDEFIDDRTLFAPPDKDDLTRELARKLGEVQATDYEFFVHELSRFKHVNLLRIAAADISGNFPLMKVSDHLTGLAEVIAEAVFTYAWNQLVAKYGTPCAATGDTIRQSGFAIAGYGKLGGYEMGYASDLDLVFLYAPESDTQKGRPLTDDHFYARLGQRISHTLSLHTPAGTMYETDLRLRPGGKSGIIVTSIKAFESYHENLSDTWEHQAIIRARIICGDPRISEAFETIRREVVLRRRNHYALASEIINMRDRMRKERIKCPKTAFDLKESHGGIVDIEFLVQFLVLKYAEANRSLLDWTDTIRLLETLQASEIIDPDTCTFLKNTYILFRSEIHRANLQEKPPCSDKPRMMDLGSKVTRIWNLHLQ